MPAVIMCGAVHIRASLLSSEAGNLAVIKEVVVHQKRLRWSGLVWQDALKMLEAFERLTVP